MSAGAIAERVGMRLALEGKRPHWGTGLRLATAFLLPIAIGVVATPDGPAQDVCDLLVAAGVRSVLNFAPCVLQVPDGVDVRKVDLSTELQILAFHEQRKAPADPVVVVNE